MYANFHGLKINVKDLLQIYQRVCLHLTSIIDCNLTCMEWHKVQSLALLTNVHSLSKVIFNSSKVLEHDWPYWTASLRIFQTFSNGLSSGLFASHSSFLYKA